MLVVPAPAVGLDHTALGRESEVRRPAVRRHVQHLDLIGIVGQEPAQAAPVVAVGLFLEADYPGRHGQDAVPAQQADRLAIGRGGRALADQLEGALVGVLQAEQEALPARPLVKVQDVGIAHDVVGTRRADQDQVDVLRDQGFEERAPRLLRDGRILVAEVDHLHAMLAMQAGELPGEPHRVAVAPARPETALAQ